MTNSFRYELSSLQRVQAYQLERLAAELAEVKEKIKNQQDLLDDLDKRIQDHQERLTQLINEQPLFWIEARELSISYLGELGVERMEQQQVLEQLNVAAGKLMADIVEARKARALLEKHKARRLEIHVRDKERGHGKLVDELVLRKFLRPAM